MTNRASKYSVFIFCVLCLFQTQLWAQRANLALGKPVTTNDQNPQHSVSRLVDGDDGTRWGSEEGKDGPVIVIIDLESPFQVDSLFLSWEAAAAEQFTIEVSADSLIWQQVADEKNFGSGSLKYALAITPQSAQYIKITCSVRSTIYGYSIWEAEVFGETPVDWVANLRIEDGDEYLQVNQGAAFNAAVYNGDGDVISDKSSDIKWSIVGSEVKFGDKITQQSGTATTFTTNEPYRMITLAAEYTDVEYSGFNFTDTVQIYVNPDPTSYEGEVRCDMVSRRDTCVTLDELNTTHKNLPGNITRLAEKDLNMCLPADAVFTAPVNIVFAIDMSGSMYSPSDPNFLTPVAVRRAIDTIQAHVPESKIGFMGFSAGVCTGVDTARAINRGWSAGILGATNPDTRVLPNALDQGQIDLLYAQTTYEKSNFWFDCGERAGGTSYTEPLLLAKEWLEDVSSDDINNSVIIFFTDGEPTADKNAPISIADYHTLYDSTNHPRVYTVALQPTINGDLQKLIETTRGYKITIDNAEDADEAIQIVLQNAIASVTPGNFLVSNNGRSYSTVDFNSLSLEKKMYEISGQPLALAEGKNDVVFQATSKNDSTSNFKAILGLDLSGTSLTKLGRQPLASTPFDAVCYEPAVLSTEDGSGDPLSEITAEIAKMKLQLETRSTGFEPVIDLKTNAIEAELFPLDSVSVPYRSDFISVAIAENSTSDNGIIEVQDSLLLSFFWENPFDPRDTASVTVLALDPEIEPEPEPEPEPDPVPVAEIVASKIYDTNGDGVGETIIVTFDIPLTELTYDITSIDWPQEGANNLTVDKEAVTFIDSVTIQIDIFGKLSPATEASSANPPELSYGDSSVAIEDNIGPVLIGAENISPDQSQYAVKNIDGSLSYHIRPDTLVLFLSETIVLTDSNWQTLLAVYPIKGVAYQLTLLEQPVLGEFGTTLSIVLDSGVAQQTISMGDSIAFAEGTLVADQLGNLAQSKNVEVDGTVQDRRIIGSNFRNDVVGVATSVNASISTDPIPVYDVNGQPLNEVTPGVTVLSATWVPPHNYIGETIGADGQCVDTQGLTQFNAQCLSSLVIGTFKDQGAYTATISVYDHIGQFMATWSQRFGACGEFVNEARIHQSDIEDFFIHDLVWDMKDANGRMAATGVYFWRVALRFDTGEAKDFTEKMGIVRQQSQCF